MSLAVSNVWFKAITRAVVAGCMLLLLSSVAQAQDSDDAEKELAALQEELKARQQALLNSRASAEELQAVLAESEKQIGAVAGKLNTTRKALAENKQQQASLTRRQAELREAIGQQQSMLAGQLKSAFIAGHYDYAKMIFYQQDAARFERIITYYKYLNQARQANITQFTATVTELESVTASLQQKASELNQLQADQQQQQNEHTRQQKD